MRSSSKVSKARKNKHAVALGKLGGTATARSMDKTARAESARRASRARWACPMCQGRGVITVDSTVDSYTGLQCQACNGTGKRARRPTNVNGLVSHLTTLPATSPASSGQTLGKDQVASSDA